MVKQVIIINRKKFATGLFWQPVGVGMTPQNYAKKLAKNPEKKYTLFAEYKSMIGLTNTRDGASVGMPSAAVGVISALSELISFLGVFQIGKYFYLIAVRNGIIIRDILIDVEQDARKMYVELSEIPEWGALFAPSAWGMPKSQEKSLPDLISKGVIARLHQISLIKYVFPSMFLATLFILFGIYVLTSPVSNSEKKKVSINPELAAEYRRQIELKKQEITDKKLKVQEEEPQ